MRSKDTYYRLYKRYKARYKSLRASLERLDSQQQVGGMGMGMGMEGMGMEGMGMEGMGMEGEGMGNQSNDKQAGYGSLTEQCLDSPREFAEEDYYRQACLLNCKQDCDMSSRKCVSHRMSKSDLDQINQAKDHGPSMSGMGGMGGMGMGMGGMGMGMM